MRCRTCRIGCWVCWRRCRTCWRRCCGEVNLSDFCRYYQQPTNNTPELALRIGSRLQELPQLLLLQLCCQYSVNAMRSDEDSLRRHWRGIEEALRWHWGAFRTHWGAFRTHWGDFGLYWEVQSIAIILPFFWQFARINKSSPLWFRKGTAVLRIRA